jgi:RND family efflux transporter MFP subunit
MTRLRAAAPRRASSLVRWVVLSAVVIAAAGGVYAVYAYLRPRVTVTEVVRAPVVQAFYATGTISPVREYPIKSNTAGVIAEVLVDKGSRVKRGQPLAVVTEPELTFREKQAEAELSERTARADEKSSPVILEFTDRLKVTAEMLDIARREELRLTRLLETHAATQNDLDRAMDRVKELVRESEALKAQRAAKQLELKKDAAVAEAAVEIARWNLEQQTLKSPVDGMVLDRPLSVGTRLAVNDHVMQVADVSPAKLVMRAQVDEENVTGVFTGQTVQMTLYAFPARPFEGVVQTIYPKADPDRRTFEVDVKLDEPDEKLSAGMTGELNFIADEKPDGIVVPSQAVQGREVWAVRDRRLEKVTVETGLKNVYRTEIVSGLAPGDRIVITPVGDLRTGQVVRTQYMDPETAAGLNKPKAVDSTFKGFN